MASLSHSRREALLQLNLPTVHPQRPDGDAAAASRKEIDPDHWRIYTGEYRSAAVAWLVKGAAVGAVLTMPLGPVGFLVGALLGCLVTVVIGLIADRIRISQKNKELEIEATRMDHLLRWAGFVFGQYENQSRPLFLYIVQEFEAVCQMPDRNKTAQALMKRLRDFLEKNEVQNCAASYWECFIEKWREAELGEIATFQTVIHVCTSAFLKRKRWPDIYWRMNECQQARLVQDLFSQASKEWTKIREKAIRDKDWIVYAETRNRKPEAVFFNDFQRKFRLKKWRGSSELQTALSLGSNRESRSDHLLDNRALTRSETDVFSGHRFTKRPEMRTRARMRTVDGTVSKTEAEGGAGSARTSVEVSRQSKSDAGLVTSHMTLKLPQKIPHPWLEDAQAATQPAALRTSPSAGESPAAGHTPSSYSSSSVYIPVAEPDGEADGSSSDLDIILGSVTSANVFDLAPSLSLKSEQNAKKEASIASTLQTAESLHRKNEALPPGPPSPASSRLSDKRVSDIKSVPTIEAAGGAPQLASPEIADAAVVASSVLSPPSAPEAPPKSQVEEERRFFMSLQDLRDFSPELKHKIPIGAYEFEFLDELLPEQPLGLWESVGVKDDVRIYKQIVSIKGSDFVMIKGYAAFADISAQCILYHIRDTVKRTEWDTTFDGFSLVEANIRNNEIVYNSVRAPWPIADRDFLQWRRTLVDPATGVVKIFHRSAEHPAKPEDLSGSCIRAESIMSAYILVPKERSGTDFFMVTLVDIRGQIPRWIVNSTAAKAPFSWVENLRAACAQFNRKRLPVPEYEPSPLYVNGVARDKLVISR